VANDPDLFEEYMQQNPAKLSKEVREKMAKTLGISVEKVNKMIDQISSGWDNVE